MKSYCLMLSMVIFLTGCEKAVEPPKNNGSVRPSLVFEGFQAFGNRGEQLQWRSWADRAEVYSEKNQANAINIKIHYFQNEKLVSVLIADRGQFNIQSHNVTATGNVKLKGENGIVLTTDSLYWDHEKEKISTKSRVKVVQKDRVLTGTGLVSDRKLESVKVLHDVEIVATSLKSLREAGEDFD